MPFSAKVYILALAGINFFFICFITSSEDNTLHTVGIQENHFYFTPMSILLITKVGVSRRQ